MILSIQFIVILISLWAAGGVVFVTSYGCVGMRQFFFFFSIGAHPHVKCLLKLDGLSESDALNKRWICSLDMQLGKIGIP